jgi:hypothetical protein
MARFGAARISKNKLRIIQASLHYQAHGKARLGKPSQGAAVKGQAKLRIICPHLVITRQRGAAQTNAMAERSSKAKDHPVSLTRLRSAWHGPTTPRSERLSKAKDHSGLIHGHRMVWQGVDPRGDGWPRSERQS